MNWFVCYARPASCAGMDVCLQSKVTDASADVDVICFLNEDCVRKGAYQVPHYIVDGAMVALKIKFTEFRRRCRSCTF